MDQLFRLRRMRNGDSCQKKSSEADTSLPELVHCIHIPKFSGLASKRRIGHSLSKYAYANGKKSGMHTYRPITTKYWPLQPNIDPVPPSTDQNDQILTQYHQVLTSATQ